MKLCKLFMLLLILAMVFTGCSGGGKGAASGDGSDKKKSAAPEKDCNWTIEVNDSETGSYNTFGKPLKYDIKLELAAWKDGGTDVYGKYKGDAYITVNVDISGLSTEDVQLLGGGIFDRKCEQLEFTIKKYDPDEYIKHISGLPGKISVAPLGDFNGMANFMSNWSTVLHEDQTAIGGGGILYHGKRTSSDGQQVPMGINMLIEGAGVTVEIPTYSAGWGTGPFRGTITGEPVGSGKKHKSILSSKENGSGDGTGTGNNNSSSEGSSGDGTDNTGGIENGGNQETGNENANGKIMLTPEGDIAGFDKDGDGKMEIFMNKDGSMSIDTNSDGKPDKTYDAEYSDE